MIGGRYENWVTSSEEFEMTRFDCEIGSVMCSKEGKGKRLWKKVKYQLVEYHSLPEYLRDNEFIIGYYRSEWPLKQAFLSIFSIHNETLNIWTHLIGFVLFLCLTVYTATKAPNIMHLDSLQRLPDLFRRAHELHLIPSEVLNCLPPLPSMSDLHKLKDDFKTSLPSLSGLEPSRTSHQLFARAIFPCESDRPQRCAFAWFKRSRKHGSPPNGLPNLKVAIFRLLKRSDVLLASQQHMPSPVLPLGAPFIHYAPSRLCRHHRAHLHVLLHARLLLLHMQPLLLQPLLGFHNNTSTHHHCFLSAPFSPKARVLQKEALQTTCYEVLMGVFYGLGALVYAARIPERWWPGKFDIAGHSHQLFHVLVVAGAYTHYHVGLVYLQWRDFQGC
ncbi:hypothetical protein TIFTF001_004970 [Ficus carica]|uniref:Uncharacterized protein n=1 Tax=Ficus carica TaxID=3494 RepID=A0AA88CWX1_FICCA|nr:hypothetical protein TIFTF001_004970 [Ficus carica]